MSNIGPTSAVSIPGSCCSAARTFEVSAVSTVIFQSKPHDNFKFAVWAPRQLPDSIQPVRTRRRTSQASKSSPLDCILTSTATSTHTDASSDNRPASACLALSRFDGSHEQRSRRHNCHQVHTLTTKWTPWSKYRLPLPWKPRTLRPHSNCDGEHMCPRTCTI